MSDEVILKQYGKALAGKFANPTIQAYTNCLGELGAWLEDHHRTVGGLAGVMQASEGEVRRLLAEYRRSHDLPTKARTHIKAAVDALRAELPDKIVLDRFRDAAHTRLKASTVKVYASVLRSFRGWLVTHRAEAGGLAGFAQTEKDNADALMSAYLESTSPSTSARLLLKAAAGALRAEKNHATDASPDEIVLERFRDAAHTRLAATTVKIYEGVLRSFGLWLRGRPATGGLEELEDADWDDAHELVEAYCTSSNRTKSTEKMVASAAKALLFRLGEPDEVVLKRFGDVARPGTASRTISDRQSQLRAFGYWLQRRYPRAGDGHLPHIQEADKRRVDTVVTEYRSEIAQKSPHADRIAGAVDVLQSVGIVLGHYDQAARDGGEPDNPRGASQNRLSAFSFWLAQHHLDVGGLAGIIRAGQADVDMLLRAYSEDTSEQKALTPKEKAEFKRNIESAVDALRAYCREVSEADQGVLDQYGQATHHVGVRDTVQQRDSRRNLIYLCCFSLWLEDSHQGVGLAEIRAGKANLEALINKYCESADAMSPRRKRTLDAIDALRQSGGGAINH